MYRHRNKQLRGKKMDNKGDGVKLDRFFVSVPDEVVEDFVADMVEQVRTAQEMASCIIVLHYRQKHRARLQRLAQQTQAESDAIPVYGAKPPQAEDKDAVQNQGDK